MLLITLDGLGLALFIHRVLVAETSPQTKEFPSSSQGFSFFYFLMLIYIVSRKKVAPLQLLSITTLNLNRL